MSTDQENKNILETKCGGKFNANMHKINHAEEN